MMQTPRTLAAVLAATGGSAMAHSGHGLGAGSHWHASDGWGFALVLALAATAWWLGRRK